MSTTLLQLCGQDRTSQDRKGLDKQPFHLKDSERLWHRIVPVAGWIMPAKCLLVSNHWNGPCPTFGSGQLVLSWTIPRHSLGARTGHCPWADCMWPPCSGEQKSFNCWALLHAIWLHGLHARVVPGTFNAPRTDVAGVVSPQLLIVTWQTCFLPAKAWIGCKDITVQSLHLCKEETGSFSHSVLQAEVLDEPWKQKAWGSTAVVTQQRRNDSGK